MSDKADLVIRNGSILDGTGREAFTGDVAVKDGRIVAVGAFSGEAIETVDATGLTLTPGFIDVHTHYDGQLIWSEHLSPSSGHGVTTVVTGNCGVGFAPCKPEDHTRLIKLLEGVEDMPEVVLAEGLTWDWETFPEYVEALKRRQHDIDFAVMLPHAAVRMYVMGERAVDKAIATPEDLVRMREIAREAVAAGAIGFGTSRNIIHTTLAGDIIPTAHSPEEEYKALAEGMREAGGGAIQAILNLATPKPDLAMFKRVADSVGSPLSFSLFQTAAPEADWRETIAMTRAANDDLPGVTAQVFARPVGVLLGLEASYHPFSAHPAYEAIAHLPLAERVAKMRDPRVREAILTDQPSAKGMVFFQVARLFDKIYRLGEPPCYEPDPETSVAAVARATGRTPDEVAYDWLLEQDGKALLFQAAANFEDKNLEAVREMLGHPNAVPALGDGGAHYGMICDSTYTTFLLTWWGRDRPKGRLAMTEIVRLMTTRPAEMLGLKDRGRIAVGQKADLNLIDLDALALHAPRMIQDLPNDGKRLMQDASGYKATYVSGVAIQRDGVPTGALPGRMVERSALAPLAMAAE